MKKTCMFGALVLALLLGGAWLAWRIDFVPEPVFELQTPFFSDKNVMVLVPHQDDEVCLAGGIIEQYTSSGSRVSLVYATNGDYHGLAEVRSREALAAAEVMGVPSEDVYYLGYGNQWQPQGEATHIYFSADGDTVWTSHYGATATYGTEAIDCYADSAYTRNNFCRDLGNLILELRPDVIYCNDYDPHHDHMALDLLFEEVLQDILVREPDYHPDVYKGLCYGTGWYAPDDFAGENPVSAQHPDWAHWDRLGINYNWASRVRVPMGAENLSPILSENTVFQALSCFESQDGWSHARQVLNGDKVFFQRRTDNLLRNAAIYDGTENVTVWNNFKLKDSENFSGLVNSDQRFATVITVSLPEPVRMNEIRLYAAPEPYSIYAGYVHFDDGSQVNFGDVSTLDSPAVLSFPERQVSGFSIHIQGDAPQLTEIEAFLTREEPTQYLMAMDTNGDFVYNYRIPEGNTVELQLYAYPQGSVTRWEDVNVSVKSSWGCKWEIDDDLDVLRVTCPPEGWAVITVSSSDTVRTTFTISNPSREERQALLDRQAADLLEIEARYGSSK